MEKICSQGLSAELDALRSQPDKQGLKNFFSLLLTMEPERKKQVIDDALKKENFLHQSESEQQWKPY